VANINITIPDDLHRNLKIRAATEGKSLKAILLEALSSGNRQQRRRA